MYGKHGRIPTVMLIQQAARTSQAASWQRTLNQIRNLPEVSR